MNNKKTGLALGTAALGRPLYINISASADKTEFELNTFKANSIKVMNAAYEAGIRYYDTAPGYGLAEELLIDWTKEKNDNSIEVATKWGYKYEANFNPNALIHETKEHSLNRLNTQWQQSKLLLPYLRVYQIHSVKETTGVLEDNTILNRLTEIKNQHKISIGLTTTGENQSDVIQKALDIEVNGTPLFTHYQVTYNILETSIATQVQSMHDKGVNVIVKEALANGRMFPNKNYPHYEGMYDLLGSLSNKYNVGIDAIALRYCQETIQPSKILSGVNNIPHLSSNLNFDQFSIEASDIQLLQEHSISPSEYWNERKLLGWS